MDKTHPRSLGYIDEDGVYQPNEELNVDLDKWIDQVKEKMQPRTMGYIDEDGVYHGN